jgi:hypothetical protein
MDMSYVKKLKCLLCGTEYDSNEVKYNCPKCGDEGVLEVIYDYSRIKMNLTGNPSKEIRNFRCGDTCLFYRWMILLK